MVLKQASPKVKEFLEAVGARVLSLNEFDDSIGGMTQRGRSMAMHHSGFYNVQRDTIVVNIDTPNAINILDRTILHELGHWSGHSSRLQRKVVVNTENHTAYTAEDLENEEVIAEMIAYQLGCELGIVTKEWTAVSENYIASYTKASPRDAQEHVKRAVWFLIKMFMSGQNAD